MISFATAALVCAAAALVAVATAVLALRALPEPPGGAEPPGGTEPPGEADPPGGAAPPTKRPYRDLVRPGFLVMVAGCSAGLAAVTVWRLPVVAWPAWLVLATVGTVLAMVDAATTWLPNALMRPFWLATAAAALITFGLGGGWPMVLRMAVGSAAWGLLFWVVWAVSRGQLGFGDVRLAFGLGAVAGAPGWVTVYTCLLAGTVVGAVWGLAHRVRSGRRPGPFPYGMALYVGCGLGLAVTPLAA